MNGRRSFDPSNSKPFNINIYYNINSRNITNNHEVQSHPVSARVPRNTYEQLTNPNKNQSKNKANTKKRKKKYSVDLGIPTERKTQKITKKSNSNSISSGFPSQAHQKKQYEKIDMDKKTQNQTTVEKNQKKLGQLLQIFSQGKIDKANLTRQIINIFQLPNRTTQQTKQKKIHKKKRSQLTLIGNTTPRNFQQLYKTCRGTKSINAVMGIHNVRKRQSKSQKGIFTNSKQKILKQEITEKIIYCKAIDSSLFLQPDDQKVVPIIDRTNDVETSDSIILLNESLKRQRRMLITFYNNHKQIEKNRQNAMAIKIQRAWRKYKTKKIIANILMPKCVPENTHPNCLVSEEIQKCQNIDENSMSVQNFLSQELEGKKVLRQGQKARVDQLRDHEIKKWNQIMDYVKISMKSKQVSSDECLRKVIEYFENAKKTVEKQLIFGRFEIRPKQNKRRQEISEIKISKKLKQIQLLNRIQKQIENQQKSIKIESIDQSQQSRLLSITEENNLSNSRVLLHQKSQFLKSLQKINNHNLSFQVVENALFLYQRKLHQQYKQKIKQIDIHSINYLESKRKIEDNYKQSKKQIKRIINNLNKGYNQAKNILERNVLLSEQETIKSSKNEKSRQNIQKCKSDDYLLKTAINYKKYIQKKEKNQIKFKQTNQNSNQLIQFPQNSHKNIKNEDNINIQVKSLDSSSFSDKSLHQNLEKVLHQHIDDDYQYETIQNKSNIMNQFEGGQGMVQNKDKNFQKLQQKIFSQQFLQYEEMNKKFDEQEQRSLISINSNSNELLAQQISLFQNNKINQINKRLKLLTNEDKDDIFQFLFIDLTLQLITQYDQQTNLYKSVRKFVEKKKKLELIPKGVKTSLQGCKDYINILTKSVITQFSDVFLKHIEVPMGPTARQMLKYMHQEQESQQNVQDQQQELNVPLILPVTIFEKLQNKLAPEYPRYYEDETKQASRRKFLKSVDHIHHKAIFDCLNESLDIERPYGIWGIPFPWKTTNKTNRNFQINNTKKFKKLQKAIQKVIQCCSCMCGIMADKQDSVFGNNKVTQNYIEQIRQDRMSKTLANQLEQNQDRWQFYQDQQTQVIIELSRYLTVCLVEQFLMECHLSKNVVSGGRNINLVIKQQV